MQHILEFVSLNCIPRRISILSYGFITLIDAGDKCLTYQSMQVTSNNLNVLFFSLTGITMAHYVTKFRYLTVVFHLLLMWPSLCQSTPGAHWPGLQVTLSSYVDRILSKVTGSVYSHNRLTGIKGNYLENMIKYKMEMIWTLHMGYHYIHWRSKAPVPEYTQKTTCQKTAH